MDIFSTRGRPDLIVPVMPQGPADVPAALDALAGLPVDVIEWRVDHLARPADDELAATAEKLAASRLPVLATLRTTREGGRADIDDDAYRRVVALLARLPGVAAVDVEASRPGALSAVRATGVLTVGSRHDFGGTPPAAEIASILRGIAATGVDVAKYACMAHTAEDLLALLAATAEVARETRVIAIAMGEAGALSRVVGGVFGSVASFARAGEASAPGQLAAGELAPVLDALAVLTPPVV